MPRGVLQGDPEILGAAPFARRPGEECLVLARDLSPFGEQEGVSAFGEREGVAPVAMRWGMPGAPRVAKPRLQWPLEGLNAALLARNGRCMVPIEGYVQRGAGRSRIAVAFDDVTLGVPALWRDAPDGPRFAILTTTAIEKLAPMHARMPVLLAASAWPAWLGAGVPGPAERASLARPVPPQWLRPRHLTRDAAPSAGSPVVMQLAELSPGSRLSTPRAAPPGPARPGSPVLAWAPPHG